MNTRLQVEHPVTEIVTGIDLVDSQISIAEGDIWWLPQEDVRLRSMHAIEARLYAEDPTQGFMPGSGKIHLLEFPEMEGVRIDTGVEAGDNVATYYDPMIAKVIVEGDTRDDARMRLAMALRQLKLLGFPSNRDFLVNLLEDETFAAGEADTGFIERNLERLTTRAAPGREAALAIAGAAFIDAPVGDQLTGWNSRGPSSFPLYLVKSDGETIKANITLNGATVTAALAGAIATIEILSKTSNEIRYRHDGRIGVATYIKSGEVLEIDAGGAWERYVDVTLAPASEGAGGDDVLKSPMAGLVTSVRVRPGERVSKGALIATVEAMKMEHQLRAGRDGVVAEVLAREGEQVAIRAKLVVLETEA